MNIGMGSTLALLFIHPLGGVFSSFLMCTLWASASVKDGSSLIQVGEDIPCEEGAYREVFVCM